MAYRSILRDGCFAGETHLVTGGGSGIGRCIAHELASLGAHVIVTGRKQEKLDQVVGEIAEDGGSAEGYAFDIRDEEAVKAAVAAIVERRGRIHGLVNNAGGQFPAPLGAISKKGFEAVVANNLTGGFLVMRETYVQSMQAHGGAVVNMAADMWRGMPGMAHSGAARAGMVNLTKSAAYEWAPAGVRINCVAPGWIASSGMDTYEGRTRELIPKLREHVPLGRIGVEAEVSSVVCFLLSPAASFVTGITVPIDGGAPLGSALYPIKPGRAPAPFDGFHRATTPDVLSGEAG
jgi:citronellol/citronellal dehydrogenase